MTCRADDPAANPAPQSPQFLQPVIESNKVYNRYSVRDVSAAPTRAIVFRCGTAFATIVLAALILGGAALAAPTPDPAPRGKVPRAVKKLWSEYPLNPEQPRRSGHTAAEVQRLAQPTNDDGGAGTTPILLTIAASMLGLSIALLVLLRDRIPHVPLRGTPQRLLAFPGFALARPADIGPRLPWGPKGGRLMSYFRRRRDSDSDDDSGTPKVDAESSTNRFAAYSLRDETSPPGATEAEGAEQRPATADPVARELPPTIESPNDPAVYEQLGEHVSTVLSSADEAAKRLQASATKEAERIRAEAEEYARKTRAAADAFAEQRREDAETQASAITADAEKRARDVRKAAEEQATDVQRDAVRRREALLQESERSEERLRDLLKVFRTMTERLENLVSAPDAPASESTATSVDDDLRDALAESRGADRPAAEGSRPRG